MEFWDVLDSNGNKTGETVQCDTDLGDDKYHLVVHAWIMDQNGHFLIQKRANHVNPMPGLWCSTIGSVVHNEDGLNAAFRLIYTELGLYVEKDNFYKIKRLQNKNEFIDIWITRGEREDFLPIILSDNLVDAYWVSWNALMEMVSRNEFVRYDYLESSTNDFSLASFVFKGQSLIRG